MRAGGGRFDFVEFEGDVLASLLGFGFVGNLTVAVVASQGAGVVTWWGSSLEGLDLMFELVSVMWGQFWCSARPVPSSNRVIFFIIKREKKGLGQCPFQILN